MGPGPDRADGHGGGRPADRPGDEPAAGEALTGVGPLVGDGLLGGGRLLGGDRRGRGRRGGRHLHGPGRAGFRPGGVAVGQTAEQQRADRLRDQHRQGQVQEYREPEVPGPGHRLLEPERSAGAARGQRGHREEGQGDGQGRADAPGQPAGGRGVADESDPEPAVHQDEQGADRQRDEGEDQDRHARTSVPAWSVRDSRRRARTPRNPITPTAVPRRKDVTASVRCTQK